MATEVACSANSSGVADGPVMTMMNKRLRALRKKYNRILQMEDRVAQGKSMNREQEDLLRSKLAVSALIEEYEHLRQPIYDSLQEEISLAMAASKKQAVEDVKKNEEEKKTEAEEVSDVKEEKEDDTILAAIEDLLHLLYFGNLFDLKFLDSDFDMMLYTRTHERTSCITYDSVTDDTTRLLQEEDLDMISTLRTLILSRPFSSDISHKNALSDCIKHAKLWLQNSDQLVQPGSSHTYAGLREHINTILGSDYITATPEIKPSVDLAAEVGYGTAQAQMNEMYENAPVANAPGLSEHYKQNYENHSDSPSSGDVTLPQHEVEKITIGDQGHNELQSKPDDSREQFAPQRHFQNNHRGNSRGGGRRYGGGYSNGRGGRGGRGGFQNGGRVQMYQEAGYYMRGNNNYSSRSGGRGGGGGGGRGGGGGGGGGSNYGGGYGGPSVGGN